MKRTCAWPLALISCFACGDSDSATTEATGTSGAAVTSGAASGNATASGTAAASVSATSTGSGAGGEGGGPDLTASPGCVDGEGIPEGESTFELDGEMRRYIVHLPNGYTRDRKWPVVLALHPNGGNIDYWNGTSGGRNIRAAVEDEAILVVAEDVTNNWPDDLDTELAYFDTILTRVKDELCVNTAEIFSMGFSGGGSFSGVLGCRRDDIRAIAIGGAIMYFDPADCINTPAAWITIGELELIQGRADFRDFWRDKASCEATSTPTDPDPCVAYDGCAAETPVVYCQHEGDHVWPAFGTEATWNFFKRFIVE